MDRPARRILRALTIAAPQEVRNVVAITGDSIPFNTVYRDRDLAWDVQDMPVPLGVFLSPGSGRLAVGRRPAPRYGSSTDEELLNADIVRLLVEEAFAPAPGNPEGRIRLDQGPMNWRLGCTGTSQPSLPATAIGWAAAANMSFVCGLTSRATRSCPMPPSRSGLAADGPAASRWKLVRPPLVIDYAEAAGGGGAHGGF